MRALCILHISSRGDSMRIRAFQIVGWCVLSACCPELFAADRVEPGQWEMVMTNDGESHTVTHCVTAEEAANVNGTAAEARAHSEAAAAKAHCTLDSFDATDDKVSFGLTCPTHTIKSTSTFVPNGYSSTIVTTTKGAAPATTSVKATRSGACH